MICAVNAAVCAYICFRVLFYKRHDSTYRLFPSVLAYVLAVYAFWQVLRFLAGETICLSTVIPNAYLAYGLHQYRGNVAKVVGWTWRKKEVRAVKFSLRDDWRG